jgi:hypothetical protein
MAEVLAGSDAAPEDARAERGRLSTGIVVHDLAVEAVDIQ